MTRPARVTIDGTSVTAQRGELLLDAVLNGGVELAYDCRAGHCGTCCVRVLAGAVQGGAGAEPGIVHACRCRIVGDVTVAKVQTSPVRTVEGVVSSLLPLSSEAVEVHITTEPALHHHAGQYAQVAFTGYPSRPFSITQPLRATPGSRTLSFHVRRMTGGRVGPALGRQIRPGHRVTLTGPYGTAYFRPRLGGRLVLVATNTGFAPIWSIAVAALRENPQRRMVVIAGGRTLGALYMRPALVQLARFPNVCVVPVCSTPQTVTDDVWQGRPTDVLPRLHPSDVLYVCGAPAMVEAVKAIAFRIGAVCYADPFKTARSDAAGSQTPDRAPGRPLLPAESSRARHSRPAQPMPAFGAGHAGLPSHHHSRTP